jgi:hypothetical protein
VVGNDKAKVLLTLSVSIGQALTLRNSQTGEEASCRVVYVSPHLLDKKEVGVEFTEPCPRFRGSLFLHLTGLPEVQKQKAGETSRSGTVTF